MIYNEFICPNKASPHYQIDCILDCGNYYPVCNCREVLTNKGVRSSPKIDNLGDGNRFKWVDIYKKYTNSGSNHSLLRDEFLIFHTLRYDLRLNTIVHYFLFLKPSIGTT